MIIQEVEPSPGIESARLEFPSEGYWGTGVYTFAVKAEVMSEPRLITTSCYNIPLFAIRADLSAPSGQLLVTIGPADNTMPFSRGFLLPRYIKALPEHVFEVSFQHWQVVEAKMNGTVLDTAPVPTDIILVHQDIEQIASACDLLRPTGSVPLVISGDLDALHGQSLFLLKSHGYEFHLFIDDGEIVLRRSGYEIRACSDSSARMMVWITWSPTQLQLMLPANQSQTAWSIATPAVVPPKSLFHLARAKKLQPTTSFATVEAFRTAVHEALCSLRGDIAESGAYNGFWDQRYRGRRKEKPTPKRETDIHRQILLLLYDWAKMRSVEIVPEYETAVGRLDICFIGNVEGQGPVPFCVEVKLAHAQDLEHGLETQLPDYMSAKRAMYGAYVVLWFKGGWFHLPSTETIHCLRERIVRGNYEPLPSESAELEFALVSKTAIEAHLRNIRVFILDVSKPISASKK